MFSQSDIDRFFAKCELSGECWQWVAAIDVHGYGRFRFDGAMRLAHRAAYEGLVGPIPSGLDLDHLCRNRACVNPDHLEPVTRSENLYRSPLMARGGDKTHCPKGHGYTQENTYINKQKARNCRECQRERNRSKTRSGIYNRHTTCDQCGKPLRERNLMKHMNVFHPEIAQALGVKP